MNIALQFTTIFAFGFSITLFIFSLVSLGVFCGSLKVRLQDKISKNDFSWLNKLLIYFSIFYLFIVLFMDTTYLYSTDKAIINCNMNNLRATIFPKFKWNLNLDASNLSTTETKSSKIIKLIEDTNNAELAEILDVKSIPFDIVIDSPLEPDNISILHDNLNTILTYNLPINLFMVYLVFMLIYIITIKYVLDSEAFLAKVQKLPLGKYIHYILDKLINVWKYSSIFWIYLILFFLLIFSSSSAYAIYGCLFILNH